MVPLCIWNQALKQTCGAGLQKWEPLVNLLRPFGLSQGFHCGLESALTEVPVFRRYLFETPKRLLPVSTDSAVQCRPGSPRSGTCTESLPGMCGLDTSDQVGWLS